MNNVMKLSTSKHKLFGYCCILMILFYNVYKIARTEFNGQPYIENPGLYLFYLNQLSGVYLYFYIIIILLLPNVLGYDLVCIKNTKASYHIITRLGYKRSEIFNILAVFMSGFIVSILINLLILTMIHFFYYTISFHVISTSIFSYTTFFSSNEFISLILYLLFSSIGCGMFSLLVYVIGCLIKNQYIFRCLGLVLGIALYIIPPFIGLKFGLHSFGYNLTGLAFIPNLITPGMAGTGVYQDISPTYGYFYTLIFYSALLVFLFIYKFKKELKYE